ncbi:unnamed protein product [Closterium sp. NIES-54]
MADSDTDSSADSEELEEGEDEPSSLTFRSDGGWLKRFFDSAFFCEWIAVTYLFKHQGGGVRDYLCDRMYALPLEGVQDYLFQICYLAVHKPSPSLEKYTTDVCSQSLHSFLRVYWFLSAELTDRPNDLSVATIQAKFYEAAMQGSVPSLRCPRPPRVSFFGRQNVFQLMSSASRRLLPLPSASSTSSHAVDGKHSILASAPSYVWGRETSQKGSDELPPPKGAESVPSLEDEPSSESSLKPEPSDGVVTHESTFWRFLRERKLSAPATDTNQTRPENITSWSFLGGRREAASTIVGELGAVTEADETQAEEGVSAGGCSPSLNQGRRNSGGESRNAGVMRRLFSVDGNGVETLRISDKNDTFFQRLFGESSEKAGPSSLDGSLTTASATDSSDAAGNGCSSVGVGDSAVAETSAAVAGGRDNELLRDGTDEPLDSDAQKGLLQRLTSADSPERPDPSDKPTEQAPQDEGGAAVPADSENGLLKWIMWKRSGGMSKEAVTLIGGDAHKELQSKENTGSEHLGLLSRILHDKTEVASSTKERLQLGSTDAEVHDGHKEQVEGEQQKEMQQHQADFMTSSSTTVLKALVATAADAASGVVATAAGAAGVVATAATATSGVVVTAAGAASGVVASAAGAASGVAATVAGAATGARLLVGEAASQAVSMVPKSALRRKAPQEVEPASIRAGPELGASPTDVSFEHMASPEHEHFHDIQIPCSSTTSFQASPAQLSDSVRRDASPAVESIHEQDSKPTPKPSPGFMRRLFKDRPEEELKEPSFFSLNAAATKSPKGNHVPVVDAPLPQKQSALRSLFSTPTFFASGATKAKEMAEEGGEEVPPSFADHFASRMGSLRSFSGGWSSEHAPSNKPAVESVTADCQLDLKEDKEADAEPPAISAEAVLPLESGKTAGSDAAPLTSAGVDDASLLTAGVVMEKACPSPSCHKQPATTSSPWSLRAEGLFSALKGGVRSSPGTAGTPLGRGATEGVSIIDIGASASPQTDDSLEGLYGAPKLPKHPSFSIRKSTVLATLDFVKALGDISFGLVDVFPNEDRQTALGESLAELNAHLAGMPANEGVFFPMGKGCFRVVRLLEDEAVLMSSRDRVPFMLLLEVLNCLPLSARKAGTAPEGMAPAKTGIPLAASQPLPMRPPPWALHMWSQARPASQQAQDAPLGLSRTLSDVALDRAMASMYSRMRLVQLSLEVCKRPPAPAAAPGTATATAAPAAGVRTDILSQVQQAVAAGAALAGAGSKPNLSSSIPSVASNTDKDGGGDAEQAEWEEYVSVRLVAVPGVTLDDLTGLDAVSLSRGRARVPSSLAIAHVRAVTHQGEGPPPGMPVTSPSSGVGPAQELLERQRVDESWESLKARIRQSSKFGTSPDWDLRSVIVKSGDDCRQEHFALQLVSHLSDIFQESGLPLWLRPYEILVTSGSTALIETITDAISLHALKSRNPHIKSLRQYFCEKFKHGSPEFRVAQQNFVESMAAYSVVCYLLQLKDRHNGNILLDDQGHIIHIDYGFMLSNSPGSVNFETAPFKLTREMVEVMDSDADGSPSEAFDYFKVLCIQGFLTCRKHAERILLLVEMMQQTRCPCFKAKHRVLHNLRRRFHLTLTEEQCVSLILSFISKSVDAWSTRQYDYYQRVLNVRGDRLLAMAVEAVSPVTQESVHAAVAAKNFSRIAEICGQLELEAAASGAPHLPATIQSLHLLGLLHDGDLNEARFLWKRIPASVKDGNAELAATWRVGQAMWKRDSQDVYEALKVFVWSPAVQPMVAAVKDRYTHTMIQLLARSFSTISPSHAATFLGLTSQEALSFLEVRDWKYDSTTDMFTPPVVQGGKDKEIEEEQRQLAQVKRLTEYVFNLEH